MSVQSRACIVGIGESRYAKWGAIKDQSELSLACDAILAAASDSGISPQKMALLHFRMTGVSQRY